MLGKRAAAIRHAIAANVRVARLKRGWTQEQLGEAADVAARYIQRIESGRINPSAVVLAQVAEAFGMLHPGPLFRKATLPERRVGRPVGRSAKRRKPKSK